MGPEAQIRGGIYVHLCSVAGCVVISLADRGLLINAAVSDYVRQPPLPNMLFGVFLVAWFVCPIVVAAGALRIRTRYGVIMLAILCEILLCVAEIEAIAPAC